MSSIGPGPKRPLNAGMDGSGLTRDNLPWWSSSCSWGLSKPSRTARRLPLGGRQQRALLAALLLRPNEAVPADQLIDALWGERPPPTASTIVQLYISRLRKLLGRDRLLTRPAGYELEVDPSQIDAGRFEALLAAAAETDEAAETAGILREALALWRGPALVDFAYDEFAAAESGRLEDLRLAALEDRIDADLALGRDTELVGEIEALLVGQPLRERLLGQLMLALYRSGRQTDALEAYGRAGACWWRSSGSSRARRCGSSSGRSSTTIRRSRPATTRAEASRRARSARS